MKHLLVSVLIVLVMATLATAQIVAGVQVGYAKSAFEDHDAKSAAIPLGIRVGTDILPMIEVGGEVSMLLSPFVLEEEGVDDDFEASQTMFGVYGKYSIGPPLIVVSPYVRVGAGLYTGGWEQGQEDGDYDSAMGFNIGAGVKTLPGVYAEFIYHIVKRKGDWEGAESMGANNWGIHVGYQLGLGL